MITRTKKILNRSRWIILGMGLITGTAQAGIPTTGPFAAPDSAFGQDYYLFQAGEVFVDLFGTVVGGTDFRPDVTGGFGIGAGYYFNRFLGVMAEGYLIDGADHDGSIMAGPIVRIPIDDCCTAFYGFAEIGAEFTDESRLTLQFGGGLDIRMTDHVSIFSDARTVFTDSSELDTAWLFRGGIRFVF